MVSFHRVGSRLPALILRYRRWASPGLRHVAACLDSRAWMNWKRARANWIQKLNRGSSKWLKRYSNTLSNKKYYHGFVKGEEFCFSFLTLCFHRSTASQTSWREYSQPTKSQNKQCSSPFTNPCFIGEKWWVHWTHYSSTKPKWMETAQLYIFLTIIKKKTQIHIKPWSSISCIMQLKIYTCMT